MIRGVGAATPGQQAPLQPGPVLLANGTNLQRPRMSTNAGMLLPHPMIIRQAAVTNSNVRARVGLAEKFATAREKMVTTQIAGPGRGIAHAAVLQAMRKVPRHGFVPADSLTNAYEDTSLDVHCSGHTLESPYMVASVAEMINPKAGDRVLEIGTGSGYQTAVLSELVKEVYTTESLPVMAHRAQADWRNLGYTNNINSRIDDASKGWPEAAPFDAIVVNGTNNVSDAVGAQLKEGGRLILSVNPDGKLQVFQKNGSQMVLLSTRPVRLPPVEANKVVLIIPRPMILQNQARQGSQ